MVQRHVEESLTPPQVPTLPLTAETTRIPMSGGVGVSPFASDEALTLTPGMYTFVIWIDFDLGPVTRWVPINTDGMGLYGCQTTIEIGNDQHHNHTNPPTRRLDTNCTGP